MEMRTTTEEPTATPVLLQVKHLSVEFRVVGRQRLQAVSDLSFDLIEGETLGVVGESGCGKSTTGKAIVGLNKPSAGEVLFDGNDLGSLSARALRRTRSELQMIFQDPISSLNPHRSIVDIVAQPLNIQRRGTKKERRQKALAMLETVGLNPDAVADQRPTQLSGGQCQRVSIARALMLEPRLLICDEAVSSLDVSVQAQILNLLEDLRQRFGLTMMFIGHDLAVVRAVSDRIAVMYMGKLCELAPSTELSDRPAHPYTALLQSSIPGKDTDLTTESEGDSAEMPSPFNPPSGCRFRTRCPSAQAVCSSTEPALREIRPNHFAACHFPIASPQ